MDIEPFRARSHGLQVIPVDCRMKRLFPISDTSVESVSCSESDTSSCQLIGLWKNFEHNHSAPPREASSNYRNHSTREWRTPSPNPEQRILLPGPAARQPLQALGPADPLAAVYILILGYKYVSVVNGTDNDTLRNQRFPSSDLIKYSETRLPISSAVSKARIRD